MVIQLRKLSTTIKVRWDMALFSERIAYKHHHTYLRRGLRSV